MLNYSNGRFYLGSPPPEYEFTSDFPDPEMTCIVHYSNLLQILQYVPYALETLNFSNGPRAQQSVLAPHREILVSISVRAVQFADAVQRSVASVQHGLTTLRSESPNSFQQFMKTNSHPRSFTHSIWIRARYDMDIASNMYRCIYLC